MYGLEKKSDIEKERKFVEAVKLVFTVKSFFFVVFVYSISFEQRILCTRQLA